MAFTIDSLSVDTKNRKPTRWDSERTRQWLLLRQDELSKECVARQIDLLQNFIESPQDNINEIIMDIVVIVMTTTTWEMILVIFGIGNVCHRKIINKIVMDNNDDNNEKVRGGDNDNNSNYYYYY